MKDANQIAVARMAIRAKFHQHVSPSDAELDRCPRRHRRRRQHPQRRHMKSWVFTFSVILPPCTVSARNGSSVFFAWYSKPLGQWYMVVPGGLEKIDPPQMLFLGRDYVEANRDFHSAPKRSGVRLREPKRKAVQCELNFD